LYIGTTRAREFSPPTWEAVRSHGSIKGPERRKGKKMVSIGRRKIKKKCDSERTGKKKMITSSR